MQRALETARIVNPLIVVRNGQEAINYLKRIGESEAPRIPLLVLLDIKMPVLDGFQVLEWVRQQKPLDRLIVAIFSASRHPLDVARAYDLHANSFLTKRSSIQETAELFKVMHSYWFCWNEQPDLSVRLTQPPV